MKNDANKSVEQHIYNLAAILKNVRNDIRKETNYANSLEKEILDYLEVYDIDIKSLKGIKLVEEYKPQQVSLEKILDVFPNSDIELILRNIVANIEIDLDKTEENLRYSCSLQDTLIKSIIKALSQLSLDSVVKVEVK